PLPVLAPPQPVCLERARRSPRRRSYAHQGKYYRVDDARIFTLPDEPPPIYVAVGGRNSVALAERAGDGMVAIHPRAELTHPFAKAGKPRYGQLALAVDEDDARARRLAPALVPFS